MKSTGMVRKIDKLGRIVLPKELRTVQELNTDDSVEIYIEGDRIILKKYEPACVFCGSADDTVEYESKTICKKCAQAIAAKLN